MSGKHLDYDSVLSVFETALNYISVQIGDILTRIEVSEMDAVTEEDSSVPLFRVIAAQP